MLVPRDVQTNKKKKSHNIYSIDTRIFPSPRLLSGGTYKLTAQAPVYTRTVAGIGPQSSIRELVAWDSTAYKPETRR